MKAEEFDKLLVARLEKIKKLLRHKATEYATDIDQLHNFKQSVEFAKGRTPAQVCMGFALKHWTSLWDIVDDLAKGNQHRLHLVEEKVSDAISYLILLEALIAEER